METMLNLTHRLPTELLQLIFSFVRAPQNLVCTRWRDISINTPELWSSITLLLDTNQDTEFFQLALERSTTRSLDITITLVDFNSKSESLNLQSLHVLRAQLHRWRSLTIYVLHSLTVCDILVNCQGHAPLLEELSMTSTRTSGSHISETWNQLFQSLSTPRLRRITMDRLEFSVHPGPLEQLQFPALESFHLVNYPDKYTFDITPFLLMLKPLREQLTKLEFTNVWLMNFLMAPICMEFPLLKVLVLKDVRSDVVRRALWHIRAPALRVLRLSGVDSIGEDLWVDGRLDFHALNNNLKSRA